jgi:hypothetical protein
MITVLLLHEVFREVIGNPEPELSGRPRTLIVARASAALNHTSLHHPAVRVVIPDILVHTVHEESGHFE